ncbi:MAG TPA: FtsX-like permease family protein [candidate division WOR-3 bacterium]|uniref:FtsX-like permease family protein n=1 Tax=candidate division WOR-3 bacterium TaxID=2052148 RepID=A0A9C9ELF6_UNCW3|nr:FtsX-like permease family protein [candidate division WOR-3 bacterium]
MNTELFIARRYLRSKSGVFFSLSTVIAIGGIFVGVAALLIALSMLNGFQNELRRRILGGAPHILVRRYFNEPIEDHTLLLEKLSKFSFIKAAAPVVYQKTIVRHKKRMDGVVIKGVNQEIEKRITQINHKMIDGVFDLKDGCVIGVELAHNLAAAVGDTLIIASPFGEHFGMLPRARKIVLRGVFDFGYYDYNMLFVFMDIKDVQDFFEMGNSVSGIELSVDDVYKTPRYSGIIEDELGYPYRAQDWIESNHSVFAALKLEKIVTFIVLALIILVAAFNIVGTLVNMVKKKTKEIGILRSFGFTRPGIMRLFIYHGTMIGVMGTVLGVIFAFAACFFLGKYRFINLPGDVYFIETLPVEMSLTDFIMTAGAALVTSFLATIYPAIRATRLTTVEALRNE